MGFDEFGWKLIVFETVCCNSSIIQLFFVSCVKMQTVRSKKYGPTQRRNEQSKTTFSEKGKQQSAKVPTNEIYEPQGRWGIHRKAFC